MGEEPRSRPRAGGASVTLLDVIVVGGAKSFLTVPHIIMDFTRTTNVKTAHQIHPGPSLSSGQGSGSGRAGSEGHGQRSQRSSEAVLRGVWTALRSTTWPLGFTIVSIGMPSACHGPASAT